MVKNIIFTLIALLFILSVFNIQVVAQSGDEPPWSKYPDNSTKEFEDVNAFYDTLDKKLYVEIENAKMNIRAKVYFKDINTILSKADEYGISRHGGQGYHPKRQVYVYITVSEDGKKMQRAIYDVETKRPISYQYE